MADTKKGMDFLEQSMEKAVEDLKVQIQDLQEGMQSSPIHAVSHEEFVNFQDRVLSMLASLESRVEVLTKHEEKLRQEMAIYKTALSARVMATHEARRVEVPKPHTFSGKQDAMAVAESLMDYKESMSSNDEGSRVSHISGGGEEVSPRGSEDDCSTDGGEEVPRSTARHGKGKVSYTRKDKGKRKQRESTPKLKCFLCDGPHLTRECSKRKALTKSAHFLVVRMTFTFEEFDRLYLREIVQLYGVSVSIISDQDPRFTAQFWRSFQRAMRTQIRMSIVFHS